MSLKADKAQLQADLNLWQLFGTEEDRESVRATRITTLEAHLKLAADTAHGWQMKALELEAERAKFKAVSEKLKDAHLERDREEGEWKMAEAIRLALAALAPANPSVAGQSTKEQSL